MPFRGNYYSGGRRRKRGHIRRLFTMIDSILLVCFLYVLNNASAAIQIIRHWIQQFLSLKPAGSLEQLEELCEHEDATEDDQTLESDKSDDTRLCDPCSDEIYDQRAYNLSDYSHYESTRRVRFSSVQVRNYNVLSVNPADLEYDSGDDETTLCSVSSRSSVTLDWTYSKERQVPVELFERTRTVVSPRKSNTRRKISGTPVSGPTKFRGAASSLTIKPRKIRSPRQESSFPNMDQFDQMFLS